MKSTLWDIAIALIAIAVIAISIHYQRSKVLRSTDYTDPLRYERMSWVGISIDYMSEPTVAWKIVSGARRLKVTGGGRVLSCMDHHLLLGDPFDGTSQPQTIGDALSRCKEQPRLFMTGL